MPCVDGGPTWESIARDDARDAKAGLLKHEQRLQTLEVDARQRLDAATNAACTALRLIEGANALGGLPPDIIAWWVRHKEEDARRAASSRVRA